jgi:hypothetical protein
VTSTEPGGRTTTSTRPGDQPAAALCDALATEHSVIYGYGMVSAHSDAELNPLVSAALNEHRQRRDEVVAMLAARSVTAPVAAPGYQLPMPLNNATDAARLAVEMEGDTAVAWRAVVEQANTSDDRGFGANALTQSAVLAARWNKVLDVFPLTTAFPGGNER